MVVPKTRYLAGFVLFASLAAYNHYFSLLFVATVGFSGLFFVNRKTLWPYIFSGVAIGILYLPHLQIFLAQAERGSIGGWLGMPSPWFPVQFLDWLFHYSYWVAGFFILTVIIGMIYGKRVKQSESLKKRFILFLWLLPAPIFGYIYSLKVEPILQYSLLIFSAPYLFILLLSFVGEVKMRLLAIWVVLLFVVNVVTLITVRKHYQIFYKQPFEQVVKNAVHIDSQQPGDVFIVNDYIPYYSEYYFRKYDKVLPYFTTRNQGMEIYQFDSVIGRIDEDVVLTSGINNNYFQIIKKYFPNWIGYEKGFTFEQYTFSKNKSESSQLINTDQVMFTDFTDKVGHWEINTSYLFKDSLGLKTFYNMSPDNQWGPKGIFQLDSISKNKYFFVDISVEIKPLDSLCNGVVVAEILNGEERIAWFGMDMQKFKPVYGEWQKIFMTINMMDVIETPTNCIFQTYVWNPNKNDFLINQYEINVRPGNPYRYALFFDFED